MSKEHRDHHADDVGTVNTGVVTVSSTRTPDADGSGDAVVSAIENAGHRVSVRDVAADEVETVRETVLGYVERADVDAVVTTGGTGLTHDDVTIEAIEPLFEREMPGFGEQFRARSVENIGLHGMLSRATAGVIDDAPVFCLPGSEQAAGFGTDELVTPVLGHVVGLTTETHGETQ